MLGGDSMAMLNSVLPFYLMGGIFHAVASAKEGAAKAS